MRRGERGLKVVCPKRVEATAKGKNQAGKQPRGGSRQENQDRRGRRTKREGREDDDGQ